MTLLSQIFLAGISERAFEPAVRSLRTRDGTVWPARAEFGGGAVRVSLDLFTTVLSQSEQVPVLCVMESTPPIGEAIDLSAEEDAMQRPITSNIANAPYAIQTVADTR
jgi:hypothetical protein